MFESEVTLKVVALWNQTVEEGKYIERRFVRTICCFFFNLNTKYIILLGFFLIADLKILSLQVNILENSSIIFSIKHMAKYKNLSYRIRILILVNLIFILGLRPLSLLHLKLSLKH